MFHNNDKSFNDNHPECPPGMRFLMNADSTILDGWRNSFNLQGEVVGQTAYHPSGQPLTVAVGPGVGRFVPIFVPAAEHVRVMRQF